MVYKMSFGWYILFGLLTVASIVGMVRWVYGLLRCWASDRGAARQLRAILSLLLLIFLSLFALFVKYGPFVSDPTTITSQARYMYTAIAPVGILFVMGIWGISPERYRHEVMELFIIFMLFLNMVALFKYLIPIFYL